MQARVRDRSCLRGLPGEVHLEDRGHAADPGELGRLVVRAGRAQRLLQRERLGHHAPGRAILRRLRVQEIRRLQAAGACHRLHDHRRIARDVAADEAAHLAAEVVVGAARREADVEIDHLVLEKRLGALRECTVRCAGEQDSGERGRHAEATLRLAHDPHSAACMTCPNVAWILAVVPALSTQPLPMRRKALVAITMTAL
jgi:hypothetical protein